MHAGAFPQNLLVITFLALATGWTPNVDAQQRENDPAPTELTAKTERGEISASVRAQTMRPERARLLGTDRARAAYWDFADLVAKELDAGKITKEQGNALLRSWADAELRRRAGR
jgi:hypothetical protein